MTKENGGRKTPIGECPISGGHDWEKLILCCDEFDIERRGKTKDTVDALRWIVDLLPEN